MIEQYWNDIPVGKENAVSYAELCFRWNCKKRAVRSILHELSRFDSGDDFILIRSSGGKGFYKTADPDEIKAYKRECLSRGRNVFAPIKKINRVLDSLGNLQYSFSNNLRAIREGAGMDQAEVAEKLQRYDESLDEAMIARMENGYCLPTPYQRFLFARLYDVNPADLVEAEQVY